MSVANKGPFLVVCSFESLGAILPKNWPGDLVKENGRLWGPWHIFQGLKCAQDLNPSVILDVQPQNGETWGSLEAERKALLGWAEKEGIPVIEVGSKEILEEANSDYALLSLWLEEASPQKIIEVFEAVLKEKACSQEPEENELPDPHNLIPVVPFPWGALPQRLVNLWKELTRSLGVPEEAVATLGLGVLGGVIGRRVVVSPKYGWEEHLALWTVFVKPPGWGSTPLLEALMAPIHKKQKQAWDEYERALEEWKNTQAEERGPKPRLTSFYLQDATVEKIVVVLSKAPLGLILEADELSGFLRGLGQYKAHRGSDLEHMLSIFSGHPVKADRIGRDSVFIDKPSLGIVGGVQPKVLTALFTQENYDNGLVPRFLFFVTQTPPPPLSLVPWSEENQNEWECFIDKLTKLENVKAIFSKEAQLELRAFDADLNKVLPYLPDKLAVFKPKTVTYTVRLAGLIHTLEAIAKDQGPTPVVQVETIRKAISLARFYLGQARCVVELYGNQPQLKGGGKDLVEAILSLRGKIKAGRLPIAYIRDAYNARTLPELRLKSRQIVQAIKDLKTQLGLDLVIQKTRYDSNLRNNSCLIVTSTLLKKLSAFSAFSVLQQNKEFTSNSLSAPNPPCPPQDSQDGGRSGQAADEEADVSYLKTRDTDNADKADDSNGSLMGGVATDDSGEEAGPHPPHPPASEEEGEEGFRW